MSESTQTLPSQPGIYKNIDYDDYSRIDALRFSNAKAFSRTPLHARFAMENPSDDTKSTFLGTAVHKLVLEPSDFTNCYAVGPKVDKRTKAGKQEWMQFELDHPNQLSINTEEMESVHGMAGALMAHPFIREVIEAASGPRTIRELTVIWPEKVIGGEAVLCKCRIDLGVEIGATTFILDLKTTKDAAMDDFARSINNFKYHGQAASYMRGLSVQVPTKRLRRWVWGAVENKPPYAVAVYEPSEGLMRQGEEEYLKWVADFALARKTGNWPGYATVITPIDLPRWAQREFVD